MGSSSQASPQLLPRLIVLALVVALGQLWVRHHLGWGSDTPWIAGLIFVATAADKFLGKVLSKETKEGLDAQVRQKLEPVLTGSFPMLVCAVAAVAGLMFSSVIVIPGSDAAAGNQVRARLLTVDGAVVGDQPLGPEKSATRFRWLRTSPFGRPYRLAVDGYLEESITVYPLVGLNVTPDRDLRRSPSVLFRPPAAGIQSLAGGGKFIVTWRSAAGPAKDVVPPQSGHRGSFLVGRAQPIPAGNVAAWRLELAADNVPEPALSEMMLGWSRPRVLQPAMPLAPGMTLVAEIRSRVDRVIAHADVVLGTEALVDVLLLPVPAGG